MRRLLVVGAAMFVVLAGSFAASAAGPGIKLSPSAGRGNPPDYKTIGNGTAAQAQWTNKKSLDGKFSILLQKTAPTADYAFAAVTAKGAEGLTLAQLGTIGFSVNGPCGGGAPRWNIYYDNNGDGAYDGYGFYGCGNHVSGTSGGWTHMSAIATAPDVFVGAAPTPGSVVVLAAVIVDESGTYYVDRIKIAGVTTGEPNGN